MKRYLLENKRDFQRCTCCVMDTTDSKIVFDKDGVCDYCLDFEKNIKPYWNPAKSLESSEELKELAKTIKSHRRKKQKYDCIIGMSGGADSSYLCYVAKVVMGLNPLAYVVDTGWNLDVADNNIETICKKLNIDVITDVINWNEMADLQIAFLKSAVPYQDLPQDHAIFASLYNYAAKHKIKYVFTGANNSTECIRPPIEWVYQNDLKFIKDVHKKYGKVELKTFPKCGLVKLRFIYPFFKRIKRVAPLNLIPYDKNNIQNFLAKELGWQSYKNKHFEDRFTRWYEGYYLIEKFGYDKRKCYFSNLILTGEITRDEALKELEKKPYDDATRLEDQVFICKKLGISEKELEEYLLYPNRTFEDYKNSFKFIQFGTKVLRKLKIEKKLFR